MPEEKATSHTINGVQFALPFKMTKDRFKKLYGKVFEGNVDTHFETLKTIK